MNANSNHFANAFGVRFCALRFPTIRVGAKTSFLALLALQVATLSCLAGVNVNQLRCEYFDNPLGIDAAAPRLSWQLQSSERGQKQTAYRVRVASSETAITNGVGDLWDSGRVVAEQSFLVRYAGKPLAARQTAFWQVQVWDKDGQAGDWSPIATWELGLPEAKDWSDAKWIRLAQDNRTSPLRLRLHHRERGSGGPKDVTSFPSPLLRSEFEVKAKVLRARAYVSGLGYSIVYVNGERCGDAVLDPGQTTYDVHAYYVTHDVTHLLRTGRNAIGAMLGNGFYGQNLKNAAKAKDVVTLPEYFGKHGYHTLSAGKIFHKHATAAGIDEGQWAFHEFAHPGGSNKGMLWEETPPPVDGIQAGGTDFAWGACTAAVQETKDYVACTWAADQMQRDFDGKPFFLALGISKPHLPWYVPQQFFDLYPLERIEPVEIFRDDLDDIVRRDGRPIFSPDSRFLLADKANMHKQAQRAYLASISYVDHCLGVLFDAMEKSKYADDTLIMIWGDHGWHLSEKLKYGKTDLWEESDRVPFIVGVPGLTPPGFKCEGVVNLLDMYPTLVELCGLPPNPENEGRSFAPLLKNPGMDWNHPTLTTYQFKNHSLTDGRYRYTWYGGRADGAEELYDHSTDPMEHKNLASDPEYSEVIAGFKKHLPTHDEPDSPRNGAADVDKKAMRKRSKSNNDE